MSNHPRRRSSAAPTVDARVQAAIDASRTSCLCAPRYRTVVEAGELVVEIVHAALCPSTAVDVEIHVPRT